MSKSTEYHQFRDANNHFEISVQTRFLEVCPNPETLGMDTLVKDFKIHEYFHNPEAPALTCLVDGKEPFSIYIVNGKYLSLRNEESAKVVAEIENRKKFESSFDELLKD